MPGAAPSEAGASERASLPRVLVIDDEESLRHLLRVILERSGYEVLQATDGVEALDALVRNPDVRIALCDIRMPRMDGLAFLDAVRGRDLRVVMMSAYGTTDTAVEALKRGAADYVSKPFRADEIRICLERLLERDALEAENRRLRAVAEGRGNLEGFVGQSAAARAVMDAVVKIAGYPSTVLLTGESGTGKELLARALHARSTRADRPFVAVNCAAIPESLLESELFGHERGAFTGAIRSRAGLFEQADGGTLLLDEIGDMPAPLQSRLLRVLEEGSVRRIGGNRDIPVDVRLVAATAQDLERGVADGRFRDDLYYRLNVLRVRIPPLRERREDIPLLVDALTDRAARRLGCPRPRIGADAMRALLDHDWPGNVRQLENTLERAVILAAGVEVRQEDLPPELQRSPGAAPAGASPAHDEDLSIKRRTADLERDLIVRALRRTGGNRSQAARLLDISYKALVYKIRDYGVDPDG